MTDEKPEYWYAYREGLPLGYSDVVGPFLNGDDAMDFVEARDGNWDCTVMTAPQDWKQLRYPSGTTDVIR